MPLSRVFPSGRCLLGLLPLVLAACTLTGSDPAPEAPVFDPVAGAYRLDRAWPDGLHQTLYLSTMEPANGDTLLIRSVVTHRGTEPVEATWRVCGLELTSEIRFEQAFVLCAAYSATGPIAPGDTLVAVDGGRIQASPGTYPLTVQHLLRPPRSLTVEVQVRP
ncbi:MAG: hypothetical protein KatS3mg042_0441 [Rhodothermaceae bacterium]|nr:MAG: hypothetical protein KatS3mg042_0441 [Rhodothermaceae bacterium]